MMNRALRPAEVANPSWKLPSKAAGPFASLSPMLEMLAFFLLAVLMVLVIVGVMFWFFFLRGR